MDLNNIIGAGSILENLLSGGVKTYRVAVLQSGENRLVLPVTPWKYSVSTAQNNKVIDILDSGEMLLFGNPRLQKLKVSCFFPAKFHEYSFVVGDTDIDALECVDLMKNWKENKTPIRVIITESPVNIMMAIQRFDYNERDGSKDIYFSLEFIEHKEFNVPASNYNKSVDEQTGLKVRNALSFTNSLMNTLTKSALDRWDLKKFSTGLFSSFL